MAFPTHIFLLAVSFIGVGSLAYYLFSKDDEDEKYVPVAAPKPNQKEVKVPKDSVGLVIGRQGTKVKEIEQLSGAKIIFKTMKDNDEFRICCVQGTEEEIELAEAEIFSVIANQPFIETFETTVPASACGRIIGKNGESIRQISFHSNAKITILRDIIEGDVRNVVIKGTAEQIAIARSLLAQKVTEELECSNRVEQSVSARSPRHAPKFLLAGPANSETSNLPLRETLVSTSSDGLLEVYASAVESPDRLWLQVKGPSTVELDRLNDTMTEYYKRRENRVIHTLNEISVGKLVAAPFTYDEKFYRAQICNIQMTDVGQVLDLYYVDYGDSSLMAISDVFELRTDYLKLRFQAIECILARVKPKGDTWSEQATELVEELTHVALWKPLTAKIHSYKDRPTRAKREGSPVPCVDLYDTIGPNELDIAHELVNRGFAVWEKDPDSATLENGSGCEEIDDETLEIVV